MNVSYAKKLVVINAVGLFGVIVINALANILPLNGITTGELSDMYPNLFVPAGVTFSIWGLIYLLLILFIVNQVIAVKKATAQEISSIEQIGPWFFISCASNILWIFAWHFQLVLFSLVCTLLIGLSLIMIYLKLDIGKTRASQRTNLAVYLPISIYLGWISVATIANITAVLVNYNWNGFMLSESFWTVVVIAAGILVGLGMLFMRRDIFHPLVVVWAYIGIIIKRNADPMPQPVILAAAWIGVIALLLLITIQIVRKQTYIQDA